MFVSHTETPRVIKNDLNRHGEHTEYSADESSPTQKVATLQHDHSVLLHPRNSSVTLLPPPKMIRQAPRCIFRAPIPAFRSAPTRRFLSTAPPAQKSRGWKNKATRLGLAAGVIYYYNTSTLFAEEPPCPSPRPLHLHKTNIPPSRSPSPQFPLGRNLPSHP